MTVIITGLKQEDVIGLRATFRESTKVLPPHGRLIDADIAEVIVTDTKDEVGGFLDGILYAADWIANQPTVIEAESEDV